LKEQFIRTIYTSSFSSTKNGYWIAGGVQSVDRAGNLSDWSDFSFEGGKFLSYIEGPGIVNLNSATALNSARRFLRTTNGTYYLAYSTDEEIIFKKCEDNEWETIGHFEGRYPALSLDEDGISVHIVYSYNNNGEEKLFYRYFDNYLSDATVLFNTEGTNYFGVGAPSIAVRNDSLFAVWECGKSSGEINQGSPAPPTYEIEGVALLFGSTSVSQPEEFTIEEIGYKSYSEFEEIDIETLYSELVSASMDDSETSPISCGILMEQK